MWSSNIVKMFHEAARKIQRLIIHRTRKRNMAATKFQALYRGWHYRMSVIMAKRDVQRRLALVWTAAATDHCGIRRCSTTTLDRAPTCAIYYRDCLDLDVPVTVIVRCVCVLTGGAGSA